MCGPFLHISLLFIIISTAIFLYLREYIRVVYNMLQSYFICRGYHSSRKSLVASISKWTFHCTSFYGKFSLVSPLMFSQFNTRLSVKFVASYCLHISHLLAFQAHKPIKYIICQPNHLVNYKIIINQWTCKNTQVKLVLKINMYSIN